MKLFDHWNYRILKTEWGFGVHEVHYDSDNRPSAYDEEPVIYSDTLKGLKEELKRLSLAFDKNLVKLSEFNRTKAEQKKIDEWYKSEVKNSVRLDLDNLGGKNKWQKREKK